MGWMIGVVFLILLAMLPLGVRFRYDGNGANLWIAAGFLKFSLFSSKKQNNRKIKPKQEKNTGKKSKQTSQKNTENVKGGSLTDFLPMVDLALDFLRDFRRKLRVRRLELNIMLAGGDPATLAIQYGKAWTALGNLIPKLERFFVIKHRDLTVECDFSGASTTVYAYLEVTMTLGRITWLVLEYGVRAVAKFLKIQKKRKDCT